MSSSTEPSSVPKIDTYVNNALSNESPSTTMIECEFCNQHLPHFGSLIHDEVCDLMFFRDPERCV